MTRSGTISWPRYAMATNGGWALGDAAFARKIAAASGRRSLPGTPGRPPKRRRGDARQTALL